jgi:S-adenosylmethionine:tRNA ribosyltransferase-isomerase
MSSAAARRCRAGEVGGCPWQAVAAWAEPASFFIYPGYRFRGVDTLVANFHLPRSTLLMLVSAFAGRERMLAAYETAMQEGCRSYSFGNAMMILMLCFANVLYFSLR